jgi:leucyl/phenylalanyl-tRNA--protein transferase
MSNHEFFTLEEMVSAYSSGYFPMAEPGGEIYWYNPHPRAIIPIDTYRPSKSLKPVLNRNQFEIRINQQFKEVVLSCAAPRKDEELTWISDYLIDLYCEMHERGFAHSVEAYEAGELVGGLYGVCIQGAFFGESMFTKVSNASKVAFHFLMEILKQQEFELLDTQFMNENVKRYGAIEVSRSAYLKKLKLALDKNCVFKLPKMG